MAGGSDGPLLAREDNVFGWATVLQADGPGVGMGGSGYVLFLALGRGSQILIMVKQEQ